MSKFSYPVEDVDAAKDDASKVKQLRTLTDRMLELILYKMKLEEGLEKVKKELKHYEENLVPETMQELGLSELHTPTGLSVVLKEEVHVSLPKDVEKRQRAFKFLRETGNEGLIRTEFTIRYGVGGEKAATALAERLKTMSECENAVIACNETVHPSTLTKFVKEIRSERADVPLSDFGAYVRRVAEVKKK